MASHANAAAKEPPVSGPTARLCEAILREASYDVLPQEAIEAARGALMDCVANMLAGSREPTAAVLMDHLGRFAGRAQSTVVGHVTRTDPMSASFANGTFAHVLDYEVAVYPLTQPASSTIP